MKIETNLKFELPINSCEIEYEPTFYLLCMATSMQQVFIGTEASELVREAIIQSLDVIRRILEKRDYDVVSKDGVKVVANCIDFCKLHDKQFRVEEEPIRFTL